MGSYKEYQKGVESVLKKVLIDAIIKGAVSRLPFLANPILGIIFTKIVEKLVQYAMEEAKLRAFYAHVDFRLSQQGRVLEQAMRINSQAQKTGSENEKIEAEKLLEKALVDFVTLSR